MKTLYNSLREKNLIHEMDIVDIQNFMVRADDFFKHHNYHHLYYLISKQKKTF